MFARSRPNTICARCLARRYLSTSSSILPPSPPPSGAAKLTNRRLLALSGHDATHFLQGIVTQNIRPGLSSGLYSAFLNAQGRVLHDVFIYPTTRSQLSPSQSLSPQALPSSGDDPGYLIEVDATEASRLLSHIKKYKLRAKLSVRLVEDGEWDVWSVWDEREKWTPHSTLPLPETASLSTNPNSNATASASIGCIDPRAPGLGRRLVLPSSQTPFSSPPPPSHSHSSPGVSSDEPSHQHPRAELTTLDSYTLRRILHGVPEGQAEIPLGTALPLECNMDYMGGIDFRKGCYVGQELTIRTRHTGVVRKRVLPVRLYFAGEEGGEGGLVYDECWKGGTPGSGTNIVRVGAEGRAAGRSAGRWVFGVGNVGLALCRLESMVGEGVMGEFKVVRDEGEEGGREVRVKAFVPSWHLNQGGVRDVLHNERNT